MKFKLLLIAFLFIGTMANAQFFSKSPVPGAGGSRARAIVASAPTVQDFIKPIVGISASVSNGTSLDGGIGVSWQHSKANTATNSWDIQYTVSAIGFLGTTGKIITGTAGLIFGIPGTGGLVQIGPGYDFTQKQLVLLTGVGIPLF